MNFNLFKRNSKLQSVPEPAQVYKDMRNQILTLAPNEVGMRQSPKTPNVWGVLMEMGYLKVVVTLVSLVLQRDFDITV